MIRNTTLTVLLLSSLFTVAPSTAGELAGVTLADSVKVGEEELVLNGMALRSKAIFKVYVAGLYLKTQQSSWESVLESDSTRRLDMHWVRSVSKAKICDGWTDGLEANNPNFGTQLEQDFETLCSYMEDARAGDEFLFSYSPDQGTSVTVHGSFKGTIKGKAFADALFACWIGAHPGPGEEFRAGLMGGN